MAWGNNGDQTFNQDMIDTNNRLLTVGGLATLDGGVQPVHC
jgi:hypothetical protein